MERVHWFMFPVHKRPKMQSADFYNYSYKLQCNDNLYEVMVNFSLSRLTVSLSYRKHKVLVSIVANQH